MRTSLMRRPLVHLAAAWRGLWIGPVSTGSPDFDRLFAPPPSRAGVLVSEQTALTYSAFWACVNAIATDAASLPLIHYQRLPNGGKTRYTDSKLYRLLHDEPNPEMTSISMRQTVTAHALTWGNGYAEIERAGDGKPLYLWPLLPARVVPYRERGMIAYRVRRADGSDDTVPAADMLHIPGLGFDGVMGYSVVEKARESIGLALAAERFGETFFGNGATFGGIISYKGPRPQELSDKNYKDTLNAQHQGVDRAHKLLALYNDAAYARMGIPPNDAQFLETRLHQVEEMCRWFRMPPHKIQHLLRATNNNIEQQGIEYYTDTLRPWTVRWEQEINRKCIAPSERRIQFVEHLIDGVLRGDLQSRYAAYAVGRQWGWLCADDICDRENMNPLPNGQGKIYLVPLNMTPANRIDELISAQIAAKKTPPAPPAADPTAGDPTAAREAAAMVEAIRAALTEAQQRAEASLARAVAAETEADDADAAVRQAELDQARAAALDAATEVGTLKALLIEATDREARARADQEAAAEDATRARAKHAKATAHITTAQAALAEADSKRQVSEGNLETALAQAALAEARAASLVEEERTARLRAEAEALTAAEDLSAAERAAAAGQQAATRAAEQAAAQLVEARAAADLAAQTSTTALEAARAAHQQRAVAVIGAHRGLIADAMGRMIRRETEKARRAQATPEKLRAWIETFYPIHADICRAALLPAIRAHLAWQQSTEDPAIVTQAIITDHIAESIRQLRLVLESDADDVPMTLETTLRQWELDRADALADVLLKEAIDYVAHP